MFLKKAWTLLKNYWYVPVVVIAIIVLFVLTGGKTPKALIAAFQNARESHAKEVEAIDRIHTEEIEKRDVALKTFHSTMGEIEKKYAEADEELDSKKRRRIEKLVKANAEDPAALTKKLAELTGFRVV